MILTCPSCFARYLIAGDALGDAGRDVRCGKCGHVWHEDTPRDSLDELTNVTTAEPAQDQGLGFITSAEPIPEGVKPSVEPEQPKTAKVTPKPDKKIDLGNKLPMINGVAVAVAIFAILLTAVVMSRSAIIEIFPSSQAVFAKLGFDELPAEDTLVFDRITARIDAGKLLMTGNLINLSSKTAKLDDMQVDLLDRSGELIKSLPAKLEQQELKGEESLSMKFEFSEIPDKAVQARLKFSDGNEAIKSEAEEAHAPEKTAPTTDAADADNNPAHSEGGSNHQNAHE